MSKIGILSQNHDLFLTLTKRSRKSNLNTIKMCSINNHSVFAETYLVFNFYSWVLFAPVSTSSCSTQSGHHYIFSCSANFPSQAKHGPQTGPQSLAAVSPEQLVSRSCQKATACTGICLSSCLTAHHQAV